jgi:hypothetical protein
MISPACPRDYIQALRPIAAMKALVSAIWVTVPKLPGRAVVHRLLRLVLNEKGNNVFSMAVCFDHRDFNAHNRSRRPRRKWPRRASRKIGRSILDRKQVAAMA